MRRLVQRVSHWRGARCAHAAPFEGSKVRRFEGSEAGSKPLSILLGGIPLGCDNIGDEAIVACVVRMLREDLPDAEFAVATADPATADLLGVRVVPPFGFAGVPADGFSETVRAFDAYVWCGATGLSDYPHVALDLLEKAQRAGVPTFVWGVGMDDEPNPVFFRAHGRRRRLLSALGLLGAYEGCLRARLGRRLRATLPRCRGVWVRDPESAAVLASFGVPGVRVAADTAILQTADHPVQHLEDRPSALGLCISTQRRVADLEGVKRLVATVRAGGARVVGIPMNPKTDRALLEGLGVECTPGDTPEAVCEAAAGCRAVLSSRLHLLILAANVGTAVFGVARGSKVANWLANFGRTVEGSFDDCDWDAAAAHVLAALRDPGDWEEVRALAYAELLLERLDPARTEFVAALRSLRP